MARAVLQVARAGPLVTVQDPGRPNRLRFGVPLSGPMDRGAFAAAHAALGAPPAAAIEVSLGGLALECVEGAVTFAVAGGGFAVTLDGVAMGSWSVATLRAGARLTLKPGLWGNWAYLAFAGALQAPSWLGSAATHALSGLGGGRLEAGQRLIIDGAAAREALTGDFPFPANARPRARIKVVLGPQDRHFEPEAVAALLSQPFTLTDAYDRMGVRLAGPPLRLRRALDLPSEPIVRGAIQVAGDGVATVLLADHQTTGGYPKIAAIVSSHLDGFAQVRSQSRIAFAAVSPDEAVAALRTQRRAQEEYLARLRRRAEA